MRLYSLVLCLSYTSLALAHPGHGDASISGFLHLVTEPDHLLMIGLFAFIGFAVFKKDRSF